MAEYEFSKLTCVSCRAERRQGDVWIQHNGTEKLGKENERISEMDRRERGENNSMGNMMREKNVCSTDAGLRGSM